ncbi:MAG TPA: hypothetical protein VM715_12540 [Candidatus Acidoferrum sp.]|jgi:hypothetical protein|nr:hypothetical protein [Candidatus Acidoferrum sp.]
MATRKKTAFAKKAHATKTGGPNFDATFRPLKKVITPVASELQVSHDEPPVTARSRNWQN